MCGRIVRLFGVGVDLLNVTGQQTVGQPVVEGELAADPLIGVQTGGLNLDFGPQLVAGVSPGLLIVIVHLHIPLAEGLRVVLGVGDRAGRTDLVEDVLVARDGLAVGVGCSTAGSTTAPIFRAFIAARPTWPSSRQASPESIISCRVAFGPARMPSCTVSCRADRVRVSVIGSAPRR